MTLKLYYHPLSSYCWKALIAFYETGTDFEPHILSNPRDEKAMAEFTRLWPLAKFPVVRDEARDVVVPESTTIIEYLAFHYPGDSRLVPESPDLARQARFYDRFFDNYVMTPMQKIVGDRLRPADRKDPHGVADARALLDKALTIAAGWTARKQWAMGDDFTLADIAAAPSLYYANRVAPLAGVHDAALAYLERLKMRPSIERVLAEAGPYLHLFPEE